MCFSAQIEADLGVLVQKYDAQIDYQAFADLVEQRLEDKAIKLPKALEEGLLQPNSAIEERIAQSIREYRSQEAARLEAEMFKQSKRLADAERKLATRETKAALESRRIATTKIKWTKSKLAGLKREKLEANDSRIFPFHYAPVVVQDHGENWIRPMRYHCRPAGKPANYDRRFNGLYNARRDNLQGFWKGQFGHQHGLICITGFYENVARHDYEKRELRPREKPQNVVLAFHSELQAMTVACLWSRWEKAGEKPLDSFAAITDEPPPEISATGHDRCVIVLNQTAESQWLAPSGHSVQALNELLDCRPELYYAHKIAA